MTRSPLIWFGGKSKYAEHIISKFPAHRIYVEPFGGAAHVIAQKPRVAHEVYNDIDGNVVNFLMVARGDPERLQKACESLPYSRALYESCACHLFESFGERMKNVMIENDDFRTLIPKYDGEDVLFYVDPPYINREKHYALTDDDRRDPIKLHVDLAGLLKNVKGKVVLSYYADPLLDQLYSGWWRDTFQAYKQVVGGDGLGTEAEELLLMNFDNGQLKLF